MTTINDYLNNNDWRIKENSNVDFSFSGLMLNITGKEIAKHCLKNIYKGDIAIAHEMGNIHIHDLGFGIIGYCAGWSLYDLIALGFGDKRIQSGPAKHLDTLVHQMINFIGILQNEFAGAQAFSSVDTYLAPFVKKYYNQVMKDIYDDMHRINDHVEMEYLEDDPGTVKMALKRTKTHVKQMMQQLIFALNYPSRWGSQAPFSNLTFDLKVIYDEDPNNVFNKPALIGGKQWRDYLYCDFQEEMDIINEVFLEVMLEGDKNGRIFTFPIPTYNLTKDFDWNNGFTKLLFELTAKYGSPYFMNYIGSDLDPHSVHAMCCRLNLDLKQLENRPGGMWSMGEATGSIGNVTINLNRLSLMASQMEVNNEQFFWDLLTETLNLAKESLEIKRNIINKNLENGLMPYTKKYLPRGFKNHFSTIGVIGANEMVMNWFGKDLGDDESKAFVIEVMKFIKELLLEFQQETGNLYNLEASPAEGACYRLAKLDEKSFPGCYLSGSKDAPYLTNSTQLPVDYTNDLLFALEHQDDIQKLYTGGTIFHCFLGEEIGASQARTLVKMIAEKTSLPYFSVTPTFSICEDHGYMPGNLDLCNLCGGPVDVYSRVVGYYRPVSNWNKGKSQEFIDRIVYKK